MTAADAPTVHPFLNGSQYMDWTASNCDTCTRQASPDVSLDEMPCPIEAALVLAMFDAGTIPLPMAQRMGYKRDGKYHYVWKCPEHNPPFPPEQNV